MLEAKKSAWFETIFSIYNRNLLKRRFHSLQVSGLDFLREKNAEMPLIIYANHSSWWDGLAAFEISRKTKLDSFMMMEEKQLKKLFLFRKLGAFSVVRENPRKAVESINYAVNLLKKTDRTLWIFPQGEILPNDARPLKFYNGLSRIIEKIGEVFVVPLAMRYEFLGEFKPQIFVKIGSPEFLKTGGDFNSKKVTEITKSRLTNLLDELKTDITGKNFSKFERII
ncbi:MAG: lysophospholipid acyltransferase family protein [Pyrinomonadaceae bacterium]